MSLFLDASAVVAMIGREAGFEALGARLSNEPRRIWSAIAAWETYAALVRPYGMTVEAADERIMLFVEVHSVGMVPIGEAEARLAREAFNRYGKGRHPAQLNMGDCFAYACAKTHGAQLLYKGDDFALTDLA